MDENITCISFELLKRSSYVTKRRYHERWVLWTWVFHPVLTNTRRPDIRWKVSKKGVTASRGWLDIAAEVEQDYFVFALISPSIGKHIQIYWESPIQNKIIVESVKMLLFFSFARSRQSTLMVVFCFKCNTLYWPWNMVKTVSKLWKSCQKGKIWPK